VKNSCRDDFGQIFCTPRLWKCIILCNHVLWSFAEFDDYYMALRPRMEEDSCNASMETNLPHSTKADLITNCRNGWFREFWSQHNKCSFDNTSRKCTGDEAISDYEQEGLVPFVGESPCINVLINT
jgi:hypothetical protein